MLYRKAPKTGDELSILGFGAMRLIQKDGAIDEERATRYLRHAIDQGVNYVDTAWPYHGGESERFVGRALAGGYRDRVKLATKLPQWLCEMREDMDRYLDIQLQKLATDRIDYYLIHSLSGPAWERMSKLGVANFLDKAKASGRIVRAGFSFHGMPEDFAPIVDGYDWDFCQIQYNYLDVELQAGVKGLKYAASKNLAVMVMEPLRGGTLAAKPPAAVEAIWQEAASERNSVEWALRWLWNQPEVTVVLSGMSDEAQLEENLGIAANAHEGALTEAELQLVARAGAKYRELMKVGCTGCAYCQPCPSGVDIPACFDSLNDKFTYNNPAAPFVYVLRVGGVQTGQPAYASQCIQCMDCMDKCPQHLEIPKLLEEVAAEFEGADLPERYKAVQSFFRAS